MAYLMAAHKTLVKRAWLKENKHHRLARTAVKNALQRGKIQKGACCVCHANRWCRQVVEGYSGVEAHHNSYYPTKRLDIQWMCRAHHAAWHRLFVPNYPPAKYGARVSKDLRKQKELNGHSNGRSGC